MKEMYFRIHKEGEVTYEVDKSKFIAFGKAVEDEKDVANYIDRVKESHPGANHYVHAYVIGKDGYAQRSNDDGEPSGTAGKPILELLKQEKVVDSVIVVARYFGGIKLGAGGLIRAYSKSARMLMDKSGIATMEKFIHVKIPFEYHLWGKGENLLHQQKGFYLMNIEYSQNITVIGYIHPTQWESIEGNLRDLSAGKIEIDRLGEKYLEIYKKKVYI